MYELTQRQTPLFDALKDYLAGRTVRFDVPGHKGGRGNPELTEFLGLNAMRADVNSMKALDNLCHPVSVIREAEELAAKAFGAAHAFFIVNGTTAGIQAMIMTACQPGDKIIMPRNVHRSAINALVLCGAIPIYVNPSMNQRLGIPLGMRYEDIEATIEKHPDAKAVFVNNPTYYGVCPDLRRITNLAHKHNMLMLVDEAHGTHFYFERTMPTAAIHAGADMAAVSIHKTGGSLTQSSLLLIGPHVDEGKVRQIINLTQTTSGSYLLMISLDLARKNLALNGLRIFRKIIAMTEYARREINNIDGYLAFDNRFVDGSAFYALDPTKLSVHTLDIGLAGIEVYDILRDDYNIQIEFGDLGNFLAIISSGDRDLELERLIAALTEIKRLYRKPPTGLISSEYFEPDVALPPQQAFYSAQKTVPLTQAAGEISAEFVMCYPPGIPLLAPGERITTQVIDYIEYSREKGSSLTGAMDIDTRLINVVTNA
ncbi:MAG: aminotransferase class I/II-fold pyridoxal phosphate-dependent enzyme [Fastidiosipilaceae bacterium]|jgi:arginine decarboxylase|nr:aminotransferase class I/II-fold pyridoxal phosphate-dependent enzyme [Clostridiaceae bacterium]